LVKVTLPTKSDGTNYDETEYLYDIVETNSNAVGDQTVFGNRTIDANNNERESWMDRAGRKIQDDAVGISGDPTASTFYTYGDPNGSTEDTLGYTSQVKKVQYNDTVTKDSAGTILTRALGTYQITIYDDLGRVQKVKYKNADGSGNDYIRYEYNELGVATFSVLHKEVAGVITEQVTMLQANQAGQTVNFTDAKLVDGIIVEGNPTIDYLYDGVGNVVRTSHRVDTTGYKERSTLYVYDTNNRVSDVKYTDDYVDEQSWEPVRHYTYLSDGTVSGITDYREFSSTGATINRAYTYYSTGLLHTMTYTDSTSNQTTTKEETHSLTYDQVGRLTNESLTNDFTGKNEKTSSKTYTYDEIGRILTSAITEFDPIPATDTTMTLNDTYTYDGVGNRKTMAYAKTMTGQSNVSYTLSYFYNEFNQLTRTTRSDKTSGNFNSYEYDGRGNLVKENNPEKVSTTFYNVISEYEYDLMNHMTEMSLATSYTNNFTRSMTETNEYNAAGLRTKKNVVTVMKSRYHPTYTSYDTTYKDQSQYFYIGSGLLYTTQYQSQENILAPDGTIIASQRYTNPFNGGYLFYNFDVRGSVTNLISSIDGQSVKYYSYDEFGNLNESGSGVKNEIKYTGAVTDKSTSLSGATLSGLVYLNARFYSPTNGRFLQQDTYTGSAFTPWTQHLYSYCGNNPTNLVDPTGHRATEGVFGLEDTKGQKKYLEEVENYLKNRKIYSETVIKGLKDSSIPFGAAKIEDIADRIIEAASKMAGLSDIEQGFGYNYDGDVSTVQPGYHNNTQALFYRLTHQGYSVLFQAHPVKEIPNSDMGGISPSNGDFDLAWKLKDDIDYYIVIKVGENGVPNGLYAINTRTMPKPPDFQPSKENFSNQSSGFEGYNPGGSLFWIPFL
jgi:RHS repeat-associated protein